MSDRLPELDELTFKEDYFDLSETLDGALSRIERVIRARQFPTVALCVTLAYLVGHVEKRALTSRERHLARVAIVALRKHEQIMKGARDAIAEARGPRTQGEV